MVSRLAAAQPVRDLSAKIFAYLPGSMNRQAMAWWYTKRAQGQIAALDATSAIAEHLSWMENGTAFYPAETPTIALLRSHPHVPPRFETTNSWPVDLPDATSGIPRHATLSADSIGR
jgi:hypothetical protein